MGTAALIALIETLVPVVNNFVAWIGKARAAVKQDKELTKEQDAALDAAIAKLKTDPEAWQKVQPL